MINSARVAGEIDGRFCETDEHESRILPRVALLCTNNLAVGGLHWPIVAEMAGELNVTCAKYTIG